MRIQNSQALRTSGTSHDFCNKICHERTSRLIEFNKFSFGVLPWA
jgi:hypothetical protein